MNSIEMTPDHIVYLRLVDFDWFFSDVFEEYLGEPLDKWMFKNVYEDIEHSLSTVDILEGYEVEPISRCDIRIKLKVSAFPEWFQYTLSFTPK